MFLGGFVCAYLIAIPIILLIGAAILRGAVSLANRTIEGSEPLPYYGDDDDWADYPLAQGRSRASAGKIPEPTRGRGMLIMLVNLIANAIVGFAVQVVIGVGAAANQGGGPFQPDQIFGQLVGLPIGFLVLSTMLTMMLPTSFGRACLVSLFFFLICLALVILIFAPLYLLGFAALG